MTSQLEDNIVLMVKQGGGRLDGSLIAEFTKLCQDDFNYRPDTSCGKCIYKHALKLYFKYLQ
jgi:hypothetical protein